MRSVFATMIGVCVIGACCAGQCNAMSGRPAVAAPRYVIDLDTPPIDRWKDIAAIYKDRWTPILAWLSTLVPPDVQKRLEPYLAKLDDYFPQPYSDELRGLVSVSSEVLSLGQAVLMNLLYDVTAGCTSIVSQTSSGRMLHARNLDYPIPGLRNITIQVDFVRQNKTQYSTVNFAGYVGALTGVRSGGWAVTVNQRSAAGSIIDNIISALKGGRSIGFFLRSLLEGAATPRFQDAIGAMQHTPLMAPVYLTVSGANTGEGAVITRDRDGPADVWFVTAPSMWNIIETNYDHWKPSGDNRLKVAMAEMAKRNWDNVTFNDVYNVLSTPPVGNKGTMYTTTMEAATGKIQTMVRYDFGA